MIQVSAFIATSLDGFIARKNGELDWLPNPGESDTSDECGFADFFSSVDCLVMGRNTLDVVLQFGEWPYEGKRVLVLSQTLSQVPEHLQKKVELTSEALPALIERLKSEGCSRIYVDGGKTIQSFINESLLTDITITTIPVLLGEGIRLFGKTRNDVPLKHLETRVCGEGLVQSAFEVQYA